MPDSNSFNNLSQSAREALVDSLQKQAVGDEGKFVNVTGDTMTGDLTLSSGGQIQLQDNRGIVWNNSESLYLSQGSLILDTDAGSFSVTPKAEISTTGAFFASTVSIAVALNVADGLVLNSNTTLANPMVAGFGSVIGAMTIAPIKLVASTASQSVLDFQVGMISTASINLAASKTIGYIKVQLNGKSGYMPVFIGIGS